MVKRISATEGTWFGVFLLGQVTGILAATAVAGWLLDKGLGTAPVFLAVGVAAGSIWATVTVLLSVRKELGDQVTEPNDEERNGGKDD